MIAKKVLQMVPLALSLVLLSATSAATTTILEFIEIQQQGVGGVDGLSNVTSVTVSPDGLNVYATGGHNSLAVFARETMTGKLSFRLHVDDQDGVDGLDQPVWVTVSPDNTTVYATGLEDNGLAVCKRETSTAPIGRLVFVEAKKDGAGDVVDGLGGAARVAVSPDGKHVYVAADIDDAVAVFGRHPISGTLTFVQKLDELDLGPDTVNGANSVVSQPG